MKPNWLLPTLFLIALSRFSEHAHAQNYSQLTTRLDAALLSRGGEWILFNFGMENLMTVPNSIHPADGTRRLDPEGHWNAAAVCLSGSVGPGHGYSRCTVLETSTSAPSWLPANGSFVEPLYKFGDQQRWIDGACVASLTLDQDGTDWSLQLSLMAVDVNNIPAPRNSHDTSEDEERRYAELPPPSEWVPSRRSGVFDVYRSESNSVATRSRHQTFGANWVEDELAHATAAWNDPRWLENEAPITAATPPPPPRCRVMPFRPDVMVCQVPAALLYGHTVSNEGADHCRLWRRAFEGDPYIVFRR